MASAKVNANMRKTRAYQTAAEIGAMFPLTGAVLCSAVERGTMPPTFFDAWFVDLSDAERMVFLDDVDSAIVVAATTTDGPDVLPMCNPKYPESPAHTLVVHVPRLRKRLCGAEA